MAYRVGMKVVCIDDGWNGKSGGYDGIYDPAPVVGDILTIRLVTEIYGMLWLCFIEKSVRQYHRRFIFFKVPQKKGETCFKATCFRPLVQSEHKESMEIFRKIARTKKVDA